MTDTEHSGQWGVSRLRDEPVIHFQMEWWEMTPGMKAVAAIIKILSVAVAAVLAGLAGAIIGPFAFFAGAPLGFFAWTKGCDLADKLPRTIHRIS